MTKTGEYRNKPTDDFHLEDTYARVSPGGKHRGKCIIFAMDDFDDSMKQLYSLQPNAATTKDASDIRDNMDKLGYEVTEIFNPTAATVKTHLKSIAIDDALAAGSDSFICFILTRYAHGLGRGEEASLLFYDSCVPRRKLFAPFGTSSADWNGIPKIFFLQATRTVVDAKAAIGRSEWSLPTLMEPDILAVYSFSSKLVSGEDARLGTFFVQKLVSLFRNNMVDRSLDVRSLMSLLNSHLHALVLEAATDTEAGLQGIIVSSTLRKDFFLSPPR